METTLIVKTATGSFSAFVAFVAYPAIKPAPVVVVLHEVFGVNADMRATCNELAEHGFIAVCPDLFWRQEPGVDLNSWSEAEWQKGLSLYTAYDRDVGVEDVMATIKAVSTLEGASGKVGVMGFCLGGLMSYLTAARHPVDAAVAYHGGDTEKYLSEARAISAPLLMHLADKDEFISQAAQSQIKAALHGMKNVEIFSYPECNHAFARHNGLHYNREAAAQANKRTWKFLSNALN